MIPIPVGPEPAPQYVWAPPEVTGRIRRTCATAGAVLLVAGPVLGLLLAVLAFRLPADRPMFASWLAMMVGLAAVFLFICGFALVGARSYLHDQHVNVAGFRTARRLLTVYACAVVFCAGLAVLFLFGTVAGLPAGAAGYLVLLVAMPVLAIAGTVAGYRVLRAPAGPPGPPAGAPGQGWPAGPPPGAR
jgi:hypothetical protein